MKWIQAAIFALLMGAVGNNAAFSQPPSSHDKQPSFQDERGPDRWQNDRRGDRWRGDRWRDGRRHWRPSPRREVGFFYEELAPYGEWVLTRSYGWAWFPRHVRPSWRPYSDGRWVWTDYGWTWASYEPFGWATYHYGRWAWDSRYGWLWIPGTVWGPAWVSWQYGGGYVGWAPLPPAVGFDFNLGIRLGNFDLSIGLQPDSYTFVPERDFLDDRLSEIVVPRARNSTLIRFTRNVTDYDSDQRRVVNQGVDVRRIELATGQRVRRLRLADSRYKERNDVSDREVRIYRPQRMELDSVTIGARVDEGLRSAPPPPAGFDDDNDGRLDSSSEFDVAPTERPRRFDARQLERDELREQQDLERFQAEERRKVVQMQQDELAKERDPAARRQLQQRHQDELANLDKDQAKATDQLKERQDALRQAMEAEPPEDDGPGGNN